MTRLTSIKLRDKVIFSAYLGKHKITFILSFSHPTDIETFHYNTSDNHKINTSLFHLHYPRKWCMKNFQNK